MAKPPNTLRYFDYNATTPVAPEVLAAMLPYLKESWGNPSSVYAFGHDTSKGVAEARESVARLVGATPSEIVFTGCGTESINTALWSGLRADPNRRHVVMSAVEHPANLNLRPHLEAAGFRVTVVPVLSNGLLDLEAVEASIEEDTAPMSMMWANNETGVVFPIGELSALCQRRGILFHTDAVQAAGKVALDVGSVAVDYLSLAGHKIYAPKGVGALYVRNGAPFSPLIAGGGQEGGRRAGTQNVASIVAMGEAARLAAELLESEAVRVAALRDRLETTCVEKFGAQRNGDKVARVPNTANLAFDGLESEALLLLLEREGICASSGSACSTGSIEPSHVLTAMGLTRSRALGSVRISLGRGTKSEDIDHLLGALPRAIDRLKGVIPSSASS